MQNEENPGWTYLIPRMRYLETDMEYEADTYTSMGSTIKTERWYVSPTAGIEWDNYIYHPDLLNYSFLFEPGYVWQRSGPPGQMSDTDELALDGEFDANLLEIKPYATTLNYSRSQQEIQYDFFNSATVNSQNWGAASGYRNGPVPVQVSYEQSQVDSLEAGQDSDSDQTTVNLDAKNERHMDDLTTLTYQYGEFDRETDVSGLSYSDSSSYHHLTIVDTEQYTKSALRSSFLFDDINGGNSSSSSDLNALIDYNIQHTPNLSSDYNYAFSRDAGSGFDTCQNTATASLHHQLYQSLTSSLEVQGSTLNSSASGSTLDLYSAQITDSENYTKNLSRWTQLSITESPSYTVNDQVANGSQTVVPNEQHTITSSGGVSFFLNQPQDLTIISVTDSTGTIIYTQGTDWNPVMTTNPWQIQIVPVGSGGHITAGETIYVTYTVQSNPTGTYTVFANQSEIKLSFWNNRADVYALYNLTANQASSSEFVLQNENEFQAGADLTVGRLTAGGSYTDDHSSFYNTISYSLTENYTLIATGNFRAGLNFSQSWSTYSFNNGVSGTQNQNSTFYNFMATAEWHPTYYLSWNAEAGVQRTLGSELNDDLFAARAYLNWHVGELEVHVGYEHDNQNYTTEIMNRDYAFIRIRRNF